MAKKRDFHSETVICTGSHHCCHCMQRLKSDKWDQCFVLEINLPLFIVQTVDFAMDGWMCVCVNIAKVHRDIDCD